MAKSGLGMKLLQAIAGSEKCETLVQNLCTFLEADSVNEIKRLALLDYIITVVIEKSIHKCLTSIRLSVFIEYFMK